MYPDDPAIRLLTSARAKAQEEMSRLSAEIRKAEKTLREETERIRSLNVAYTARQTESNAYNRLLDELKLSPRFGRRR